MTDHKTPLTSLCSICYTDPPKYVCPRDHVKTCSLPCYKRHQQRASCNGKRDPTAYVKKDQLTTASGIDHDYNFLSGVEREFDRADRDRGLRGIGEVDQSTRRRWHTAGSLQKYLRQHNILVDQAPIGMSRQKANQSRCVQKSKKIIWTVEWIEADGSKRLTDAHEAATLNEAYTIMLTDKEREARKRKRSLSLEASSKQARRGTLPHQITAGHETGEDNTENGSQSQPVRKEDAALSPAEPAPPVELCANQRHPEADTTDPISHQSDDTNASSHPSEPQPNDDTRSVILSRIQSEQERQAALRQSKLPRGPPFFYLLRPHTTSTSRVLIPLFPEHSLTSSLTDRTVLEFPTIYLLRKDQDNLPNGYITEDVYLKKKQEEDQEVEELLRAVPGSAAERRAAESAAAGAGVLDPSKILEMLRRDVPS